MDKKLFISCGSGLEPLLKEELSEIGFEAVEEGFRGLYVPYASMSDVFKVNYLSRIASRVLLPLGEWRIEGAESLYEQAREFEWESILKLSDTFAIDFSVESREFNNSLFAAQKLKDAICDRMRDKFKKRPDVDVKNPSVQLHLLIRGSKMVVSLDTSLTPLHKRGYRQEGGDAPLHENLAAALLRIAKYSKEETLLDLCAGSGTFLIEAALIASNTPPGYLRQRWGFESLPDFRLNEWTLFKDKIRQKIVPLEPNRIHGIDINRVRVMEAKGNIRMAGFAKSIQMDAHDLKTYKPSVKPSMIIANPPYGKRLEDEKTLIPLYRSIGDFFKSQAPAKGFVLTGSMPLSKEVGLKADKRNVITHGGLDARFLEFDIYK